jgi:hypothetical protein
VAPTARAVLAPFRPADHVRGDVRLDNIIKPDHALQIHFGGRTSFPPDGVHLVDPDGFVSLGGQLGKVYVAGKSAAEAESIICNRWRSFHEGEVTGSIVGWKDSWELNRIRALEADVKQLTKQVQRSEQQRREMQGLLRRQMASQR